MGQEVSGARGRGDGGQWAGGRGAGGRGAGDCGAEGRGAGVSAAGGRESFRCVRPPAALLCHLSACDLICNLRQT